MPENGQEVRFNFHSKPLQAEAVGAVAAAALTVSTLPKDTLVVTENFDSKLVTAQQLNECVWVTAFHAD
jgi:hypothetical protein